MRSEKHRTEKLWHSEGGFALIAAILACLLLLALGMLVASLSTQDVRTSAKVVGNKKALAAAETGIHVLSQLFDPQNLAATDGVVGTTSDPNSTYTIAAATRPTTGPEMVPITGYAIGGGQQWGQRRFDVIVQGRNTEYNTAVSLAASVGYGPIEITTMSR